MHKDFSANLFIIFVGKYFTAYKNYAKAKNIEIEGNFTRVRC